MGKRTYILLFLGLFLGLFLFIFSYPQKIKAADNDLVINEIMPNPDDGDLEWIELFNKSSLDINLDNYTIEDNTGPSHSKTLTSCSIKSNSYLVLEKGSGSCKFSFTLNNDSDILILKVTGLEVDSVSYGGLDSDAPVPPKGESIARSPNGHDTDNDAIDFKTQSIVTPGTENPSLPENTSPSSFYLVSPENEASFTDDHEINFSWQAATDVDGDEISYSFYLSCISTFPEGPKDSGLSDNNYLMEELDYNNTDCPIYYWKIVATDGTLSTDSLPTYSSFRLSGPFFSNDILINELYPDPTGNSDAEWIELYNNSDENIDLKEWILEDLKGSIHQFKITSNLVIPAWGYVTLNRSDSGVTLNNDQDGVRIIRPDNYVLYETPIFTDGDKGWSFVRNSSGTWEWTTTVTPTAINIITPPIIEDSGQTDEENVNIPINDNPVVIATGEFRNFENYLVTVTGTVVETSGNTFYLDDGSGKTKVYIQEATGIDKPPMHKGDVFEVTGVVNLYRNSWRILPQKQDDIELIRAVEKTSSSSSVIKKASAKSSAIKSPTTSVTARSPTKQVAGMNSNVEVAGEKSPWWIQMIKVLVGLAAVILVIFIIQLRRWRRENPMPSDFGDET